VGAVRYTYIFVLGAILTAGQGLGPVCAQGQGISQEDIQLLTDHFCPAWIPTRYNMTHSAGQPPGDDFLASVKELTPNGKTQIPTLLMIYSGEDAASQPSFERALFRNLSLALTAKVFTCLKLDVKKSKSAREAFGRSVPRFVLYDSKGRRRADISMAEHRIRPQALLEVMKKVLSGYGAFPLDRFINRYKGLPPALVPLEAARNAIVEKEAILIRKRGAHARKELQHLKKEQRALSAQMKEWRARVRKLISAFHKGKK